MSLDAMLVSCEVSLIDCHLADVTAQHVKVAWVGGVHSVCGSIDVSDSCFRRQIIEELQAIVLIRDFCQLLASVSSDLRNNCFIISHIFCKTPPVSDIIWCSILALEDTEMCIKGVPT